MKITDVTLVMHSRTLPNPLGPPILELGVLSIVTDEGVIGETFVGAPGPSVTAQIVGPAKQLLIGRDPLDIGAIWRTFQNKARFFHASVQGYIDVALWDIAGKTAGLPVHRLLGTCRESVPCYTSSWVHPDVPTYAEEALAYRDQGFPAYKLHPPTQRRVFQGEDVPLADDIAACTAIRDAVGDDYVLMLDSAWAYNYAQALTVGQAIQDLGYYWYEDPLKADDIYGYVRLKERLHIPIVATEVTDGGVYALPQWLLQRATDALRGDTVIKGGITGLMKIAHLAEAFQMNCEVHDGYNAMNNAAGLNVIMAIDNCEFFEIITIHAPGSYDLDHLNYGLAEPFDIDAAGNVHAPTQPGLGFDVDWDLINSSVIARL